MAITSTGLPAACPPQPGRPLFAVPAPGVIEVSVNGDEIDVAVLGGLAASHQAEQPHLTHPGPGQPVAGPAGSRRRRNRPDLGQRHATAATLPVSCRLRSASPGQGGARYCNTGASSREAADA